MNFNKNMIPDNIDTFEELQVWLGLILSNAAAQLNKVYVNNTGQYESVASQVVYPVRPPNGQNVTSEQIDFFIYRCAIALENGFQLLPGKPYIHSQEFFTDAEFTIPSDWLI